ncbi:Transcription initiation factor IIE subunit beta [Portunus trituberculatus]|uniref:Transcription initiation factor IIE subunit beta n=1 Tax=Portunus trituberculatus TaxID=210409 RepID=A0A5B7IQK4_PORTR|nr:Transcription initiation factor IIE subunit beta [Portunus trituberculatus]
MKAHDNVILMTAKDQLAAVDQWGGGKDESFFVYSHMGGRSTNRYKTVSGGSQYKFGVLARIVRHMKTRHQDGEMHPLSIDEILDETNQLNAGPKVKQVRLCPYVPSLSLVSSLFYFLIDLAFFFSIICIFSLRSKTNYHILRLTRCTFFPKKYPEKY